MKNIYSPSILIYFYFSKMAHNALRPISALFFAYTTYLASIGKASAWRQAEGECRRGCLSLARNDDGEGSAPPQKNSEFLEPRMNQV
jgi:hypothetical protein